MNKNGMTLVELMVASVISVIVLMGLSAVQISMQKNMMNSSMESVANDEAINILNQILTDASMAVGQGTSPLTKGILVGDELGNDSNRQSFCIHQDNEIKGNIWSCYTRIINGSKRNQLFTCSYDYNEGLSNRGASACQPSDQFVGIMINEILNNQNPTFEDRLFTMTVTSQVGDDASTKVMRTSAVSPIGHSL